LRVDSLAEGPELTTKNSMALAMIVPAVPAALLGFFLVTSFLRQLDPLQKQGTMYVALYGTTLAACAAVLFLPLAVLIFGPRSAKAPAAPKGAADKAAPKSGTIPATGEEESMADESAESLGDNESAAATAGHGMSTGELEVVEPTPSMDNIAAYDDEVLPPSGEMPAFEEEEFAFDEEEPEPPKKKKK
jgi:hypothetical protein